MATLPTPEVVATQLGALLRCTVKAEAVTIKSATSPSFGLYHSGDEKPIAVCGADLPFAAFSGAAFSMIPAETAAESVKDGKLEEGLAEIFGEVLNVVSRMFGEHDTRRVTLMQKSYSPAPPTAEVVSTIRAAKQKLDIEVDIDGYGKGLLMFRVM
jgi:hypothetical protein